MALVTESQLRAALRKVLDSGERKQGHKAADDQATSTLSAIDHDLLTDLLLAGVDPTLSEFGL